MRRFFVAGALAVAFAFAACSSPNSATRANFAKALGPWLAKSCIELEPSALVEAPLGFPVHVLHRDKELDVLTSVGLLARRRRGRSERIYSLTAKGKAAMRGDPVQGYAFCAGHYKLDRILDWTTPGQLFGKTVSDVTYLRSPDDIAPWARVPVVEAAFAKQFMPQQKEDVELVMKNDGWAVFDGP